MKGSLAVDIGGTHTRIALFSLEGEFRPYHLKVYDSSSEKSFEALLDRAFQEEKAFQEIEKITIGVAGTVERGQCKATNIPWVLDRRQLEVKLKIPVKLINDLQAAAYSIFSLPTKDFVTLQEGQGTGIIGIIGAGTGLGEAFIADNKAYPSEGGHGDFAPVDQEQWRLVSHLSKTVGRVSVEQVCSGPGLGRIYTFLNGQTLDPAKITEQALQGDKGAIAAVELFLRIYAQEAGNVALRYLTEGGLYFSGGIAPRLIDWMRKKEFVERMCDKGVKSSFVKKVSVKVIMNEFAPLYGSAWLSRHD